MYLLKNLAIDVKNTNKSHKHAVCSMENRGDIAQVKGYQKLSQLLKKH